MEAIAIGPLVFSADRLTAILAIAVFWLLAELLARRVDTRLSGWAFWSVLVFVAFARFGHVLDHLPAFRAEPLRALAVWQGGFKVQNGVIAAMVFTLIRFRGQGRLLRWTLLPAGAALALALAMIWRAPGLPPTALPVQAFARLDAEPLMPADLTGQPVVVNLWATWCPPCRREMPMMAEIADRPGAPAFLFVNQGEDAKRVANYLDLEGLQLENALLDPYGEFARHYATLGLPVTMFIGRDGVLKGLHIGEIAREALLDGIARITVENQE